VSLHSRLDRGGALQARKLANGAVQRYWRYSLGGKTSREPIGVYDPSAPPKKLQPTSRGHGLAAALETCRELADFPAARADPGGLREAKAEKRKSFLAHKAADAEKSELMLQELLDAYVSHLKTQGRRSREVEPPVGRGQPVRQSCHRPGAWRAARGCKGGWKGERANRRFTRAGASLRAPRCDLRRQAAPGPALREWAADRCV
jgi:hypothetical protein